MEIPKTTVVTKVHKAKLDSKGEVRILSKGKIEVEAEESLDEEKIQDSIQAIAASVGEFNKKKVAIAKTAYKKGEKFAIRQKHIING